MRHILIGVAAAAACACGGTKPSGGGGATTGLHGSLIVHTGLVLGTGSSDAKSIHVLIGDGTAHDVAVDQNGDAKFNDASLTGRVDVTVIGWTNGGSVSVLTYLQVGTPEIWLGVVAPKMTPQGTLNGTVTGFSDPTRVSIEARGTNLYGYATPNAAGTFTLPVTGAAPGTVTLSATETDASNAVVKAGLLRGVPVTSTASQTLALDHPVTQTLNLSIDGIQPYGTPLSGQIDYMLDGNSVVRTRATGTLPIALPALQLTAPFDAVTPYVSGVAGTASTLPNGGAATRLKVAPGASSAKVTLLGPGNILAPQVGPSGSPGQALAAGLKFAWNLDASAQLSAVLVFGSSFNWSVIAPPGTKSFTPFALPATESPVTGIGPGSYQILLETISLPGGAGYDSLFAQHGIFTDAVPDEYRYTLVGGYTTLN